MQETSLRKESPSATRTSLLIHLSISPLPLFLFPVLYLFYHRPLYYYHLLRLSNYLAILLSLSSRVSLFALSSPYHTNSYSLPLCRFFPFLSLRFPFLPSTILPIYPTGKKREKENRGASRELYRQGDA